MSGGLTERPGEVGKFDALAARWWDPRGPMAPLHAMNPLRTRWAAARLAAARGRTPGAPGALSGLDLLDVGCGGGLASEAFARMGARVTGVDLAGEALEAARLHALSAGLDVAYRRLPVEEVTGAYDAVIAFEVVEHVGARDAFLAALAARLRSGGMAFLSTINRTARSFLVAKVGAEYVARVLPRGTHDWRLFVPPAELGGGLRRAGLRVTDVAGLAPDGLGGWRETRDLGVNYLMAAARD